MATSSVLDPVAVNEATTRIQMDELERLCPGFEAAVAAGRRIQMIRGEDVVAEVQVLMRPVGPVRAQDFDFAAQRQQMWGDRVFDIDSTQWIREDRDSE